MNATNTGATAIIDARGEVVAQLPYLIRGVLSAEVHGHGGSTPYLRFGDAPALGTIALGLLAGALGGIRSGRSR